MPDTSSPTPLDGRTAAGGDVVEDAGTGSPTLLERMVSAGISEDRAREHITRGVVRVAGEPVLEPDTSLPWPTAWVVGPE